MTSFKLNGKQVTSTAEPDTPLLWVIRDEQGLTGTKFGCGIAMCGACTVHLNGKAQRSCILPVSAVEGADVVTIEGLDPNGAQSPDEFLGEATVWAFGLSHLRGGWMSICTSSSSSMSTSTRRRFSWHEGAAGGGAAGLTPRSVTSGGCCRARGPRGSL